MIDRAILVEASRLREWSRKGTKTASLGVAECVRRGIMHVEERMAEEVGPAEVDRLEAKYWNVDAVNW